jgi:hypothetical protein
MGIPKSKGGMGFRDFRCFNKAFLAKQCWRLWRSLDNLVSRILSAKYYVNNTILEAKLGHKPSYTWRSILGSCDLLKEGLFWKIGNGEDTKIWGDKWVLRPTTFAIQSVPRVLDPDAKVAELIDSDRHGWKKELLETLFFPDEIKAILSIPLRLNCRDAVIWRGTTNGQFNVKSAYHAAMEKESQLQAGSSSTDEKKMWVSLWGLQIPNAEKNFLWRACHEILPTKASLCRRKVTKDALCPICGLEEETCFHILWDCPLARDVWSGSLKKFQKSALDGLTFGQIVEEIFKRCNGGEIRLFAGIARRVWFRRNDIVHGGPFTHPKVLVQQATEALGDFSAAKSWIDSAPPRF